MALDLATIDIHRPQRHAEQGCLGTNLARAELAAMLKALIPILPRLELAAGATRSANTHVSGYSTLPVRVAW